MLAAIIATVCAILYTIANASPIDFQSASTFTPQTKLTSLLTTLQQISLTNTSCTPIEEGIKQGPFSDFYVSQKESLNAYMNIDIQDAEAFPVFQRILNTFCPIIQNASADCVQNIQKKTSVIFVGLPFVRVLSEYIGICSLKGISTNEQILAVYKGMTFTVSNALALYTPSKGTFL